MMAARYCSAPLLEGTVQIALGSAISDVAGLPSLGSMLNTSRAASPQQSGTDTTSALCSSQGSCPCAGLHSSAASTGGQEEALQQTSAADHAQQQQKELQLRAEADGCHALHQDSRLAAQQGASLHSSGLVQEQITMAAGATAETPRQPPHASAIHHHLTSSCSPPLPMTLPPPPPTAAAATATAPTPAAATAAAPTAAAAEAATAAAIAAAPALQGPATAATGASAAGGGLQPSRCLPAVRVRPPSQQAQMTASPMFLASTHHENSPSAPNHHLPAPNTAPKHNSHHPGGGCAALAADGSLYVSGSHPHELVRGTGRSTPYHRLRARSHAFASQPNSPHASRLGSSPHHLALTTHHTAHYHPEPSVGPGSHGSCWGRLDMQGPRHRHVDSNASVAVSPHALTLPYTAIAVGAAGDGVVAAAEEQQVQWLEVVQGRGASQAGTPRPHSYWARESHGEVVDGWYYQPQDLSQHGLIGPLVEIMDCESVALAPWLHRPALIRVMDTVLLLRDELVLLGVIALGIVTMLSSIHSLTSGCWGLWLGIALEAVGCAGLVLKAGSLCSRVWRPA